MASKEDSTGGATPATGEAVQVVAGVGGVRSSDDPVPDPPQAGSDKARRSEGTPLVPWGGSAGQDVVMAREG